MLVEATGLAWCPGRYIVGASDAAAIFASVGVSYWTNFSFKRPLLFSGAACLVGNLLYCLRCATGQDKGMSRAWSMPGGGVCVCVCGCCLWWPFVSLGAAQAWRGGRVKGAGSLNVCGPACPSPSVAVHPATPCHSQHFLAAHHALPPQGVIASVSGDHLDCAFQNLAADEGYLVLLYVVTSGSHSGCCSWLGCSMA